MHCCFKSYTIASSFFLEASGIASNRSTVVERRGNLAVGNGLAVSLTLLMTMGKGDYFP